MHKTIIQFNYISAKSYTNSKDVNSVRQQKLVYDYARKKQHIHHMLPRDCGTDKGYILMLMLCVLHFSCYV